MFIRACTSQHAAPHQSIALGNLIGKPLEGLSVSKPFNVWQISRWKFNELGITIQQRLCEALRAAGRANDASEYFLDFVNSLDETVYASPSITEWISCELTS